MDFCSSLEASKVTGFVSDVQRKAAELVEGANQLSGTNEHEDTLIQLLGHDNPGHMRGMGKNMSKTKLACFQVKHKSISQMQENQIHLQQKVNELQAELSKVKKQVRHFSVCELRLLGYNLIISFVLGVCYREKQMKWVKTQLQE